MRALCRLLSAPLVIVSMLSLDIACADAQAIEWTRLMGTSLNDFAFGVSTDALGNVFVTGLTNGNLHGQVNAGYEDAFISKYNAAGNHQWTELLGTSSYNDAKSVSADGAGNVFVSGQTYDNLHDQTNAGGLDAFVSKYDATGVRQWTRLLGTESTDKSLAVSADGVGNVFVSGHTWGDLDGQTNAGQFDAFVSKYDAAGNRQWTRLLGTNSPEDSFGVSADGLGNVFVSGSTDGNLHGQINGGLSDAYVSKYNAAGNRLWTRLLGTSSSDEGWGVSADGLGNVFVVGQTLGNLHGQTNAGGVDAFVSKYDTAGNRLWTRLLGTSSQEGSVGVSADGLGNVFVSGTSTGNLHGQMNAGDDDAFVSKYDAAGNRQWTRLFGTSSADNNRGASVDDLGNVFVSGFTRGDLDGQTNAGDYDAFVSRISDLLSGDYNRDDKVDAADYVMWRKTLNQSVPKFSGADGDGDGIVNEDDFNLWRANFGNMAGGAGSGGFANVPEPMFWAHVLAVCLLPISRRAACRRAFRPV